eukprot:1305931-Rhodomonas_salina.2
MSCFKNLPKSAVSAAAAAAETAVDQEVGQEDAENAAAEGLAVTKEEMENAEGGPDIRKFGVGRVQGESSRGGVQGLRDGPRRSSQVCTRVSSSQSR